MLMHRYKYTDLTGVQIDEKLISAKAGPECVSEYSDILAGSSLKIITDNGPVLIYDFKGKNNLSLVENKGSLIEAGYGALTLKHVVIFSHMIPGTQKGYIITLNQKTKLVTVIEAWFSGYKDKREVQREIYYGYPEAGGKPPANRHHTTNRISGKGFHWTNDRSIETLEFFPSVTYSSFVELTRHNNELLYCAPSDYIEIDENIFLYDRIECEFSGIMTIYIVDLFTWVEEACNGSQGTFVFNKNTMHDCGYFYGVNEIKDEPDSMSPSGLTLGSFGALARTAGYYEVKKFFGPKV